MKSNFIVYKAQNKHTGEVYIGATTNSIHQRKLDHIKRASRGEKGQFQEAIGTYGPEAFSWEEIDTANDINELAAKEKEYIIKYNSKENGYNSDNGGGIKKTIYQYNIVDGSLKNSYDSLNNAGESINVSSKAISKTCLSVNQTLGSYYWSYEFKEPFMPNSDNRRKEVMQYDLDGNYLAKYKSASEASRLTEVNKTSIAKVCRGKRSHAGGYIWFYE